MGQVTLLRDYSFTTAGDVPIEIRCDIDAVRHECGQWTILRFTLLDVVAWFSSDQGDDITRKADHAYGWAKIQRLQKWNDEATQFCVSDADLIAALDAKEAEEMKAGVVRAAC